MKRHSKRIIILGIIMVITILLNSCGDSSAPSGEASSGTDSAAIDSSVTEDTSSPEGEVSSDDAESGASSAAPSGTQSQKNSSAAPSKNEPQAKELSVKIVSEGKAQLMMAETPPNAINEAPPVVTTSNNVRYSFINTGWSYAVKVKNGKSMLTDKDAYDMSSSRMVLGADYVSIPNHQVVLPQNMSKYTYWKRIYNSVFGAAVIKDKNGVQYMLSINHGENCNQVNYGRKYENSIKPEGTKYTDDQYMGYDASGKWVNAFDNYFAFVNASLAPLSDNNGVDLYKYDKGPILWPSNGYLANVGGNYVQRSMGLRHPSMLIDNGYIYVFYLDGSNGPVASGRGYGIRAARAPLASMGAPGSFKTLYAGAYNETAIPFLYNKNDTNYNKGDDSYVFKQGGRSDILFAGTFDPIRFSVAKIKNSNYYLGVFQHGSDNDPTVHFKLAVSRDLITWSEPVEIMSAKKDWDEAELNYPLLYNSDMTDYMSIDINNFLIVGTKPETNTARYVKMSVKIEEK